MKSFFKLEQSNTTVSKEILCGITTFLTMSYILIMNPIILSRSGMPYSGVFAATVLSTVITTLFLAFYSNTPYAMSPNMGISVFFSYTLCMDIGFYWQEALAITFIAGLLHLPTMWFPKIHKKLLGAIPQSLTLASCIAMGIFLAYIGIKNAGFLNFSVYFGDYSFAENGSIKANSLTVPGFTSTFTLSQVIAFIGFVVTIFLLSLEKKTGESYSPFLLGIIAATFIGVPLNVTNVHIASDINFSVFTELKEVLFAFIREPGLLSLFDTPMKLVFSILMIIIVWCISIINSYGTVIGLDHLKGASFSVEKLDKAVMSASLGGVVSSALGTTTSNVSVESISGISTGGKTGLTSLVVGLLFLACLPFAKLFEMIPLAAVAPALIIAGCCMFSLLDYIDWGDFEISTPAAMTIICVPLTYSVIDGVAIGYLTHIIIKLSLGKWREIHPFLYIMTGVFVFSVIFRSILKV